MASIQYEDEPRILSREVDPEDEEDSEYRIEAGGQVKYLTVAPHTLEDLSLPLPFLPPLPYTDRTWTAAHISRDAQSGELVTRLSNRKLAGVQNVWHRASFNVLHLQTLKPLTAAAFEASLRDETPSGSEDDSATRRSSSSSSSDKVVVAKIARFEWEIPRIERETTIYQILHHDQATDLAPHFLGHLHENGRVMGFLLEKVHGRTHASIENLRECESTLKKFHALGLLHGDVNRYNFLVGKGPMKLIDFEGSREVASEQDKLSELQRLRDKLTDDSGRGGGFRSFRDDE